MPEIAVASPLGSLTLRESDGLIVAVDWRSSAQPEETPLLKEARAQLDAYFARRLERFDLPLAPNGSAFQHKVWHAMLAIPYGKTRTYGAVAAETGGDPRAVGQACGRNPIPIIIPCHRIIAAGDRLGGYSGLGGLTTKRFLLNLEGRFAPQLELFKNQGERNARHHHQGV